MILTDRKRKTLVRGERLWLSSKSSSCINLYVYGQKKKKKALTKKANTVYARVCVYACVSDGDAVLKRANDQCVCMCVCLRRRFYIVLIADDAHGPD